MSVSLQVLFFVCSVGVIPILCVEPITVINPDDSNAIRPFPNNSLQNIRQYFIDSEWCPKGISQDPEKPYQIPPGTHRMAAINTTVVSSNVTYYNLHKGQIHDFYVFKDSSEAILNIHFTNVTITGVSTFGQHRNNKKDLTIIVPDTLEIYPFVKTTTIISGGERVTHARVEELPPYSFGEAINDVTDPEAIAFFQSLADNIPVIVRELFINKGQTLSEFYIKHVICNTDYNPTN